MRTDIDWNSLHLGQTPDREIARRLCEQGTHVAYATIRSARMKLGIKPIPEPHKYRPSLPYSRQNPLAATIDWDSLPLGKVSDEGICRQLRENGTPVARPTVGYHRKQRGISAFFSLPNIDWDSLPFGQVSDKEIAREIGCTADVIARRRKAKGVSAAPHISPSYGIDWDSLPLGQVPDAVLARHLRVTHPTVSYHRRLAGRSSAKHNLQNLLLLLVFRKPMHPTQWYADRIGIPTASARRSLKAFQRQGLLSFCLSLWVPILRAEPSTK